MWSCEPICPCNYQWRKGVQLQRPSYISIHIDRDLYPSLLLTIYTTDCTALRTYVPNTYKRLMHVRTYVRAPLLGTSSRAVSMFLNELVCIIYYAYAFTCMHAWDSIVVPHIHAGRPLLLLYFLCYHFFFHTYHTIIWVWDAHPIHFLR